MQLATQKAPPANIVLPHYAFAAVAFLVLFILLFFSADSFIGHYFNPKLLTITHIAALGWGTMIIFGSLYQLLPVILNSSLFSNLLAQITFYFWGPGLILLAFSFWTFAIGIPIQIASVLLFIAATLFLVNIIVTVTKAEKSNIQAEFIVTAALWFWVTVTIGVLMAFNLTYAFLPQEHLFYLKLHAHIGIAGWFLLLIMGAGSKLLPMFLLSSGVNEKKLTIAYYLLNAGIIGFLVDSLFFNGISRGIIYLLIALAGIAFFFSFAYEAYKKRARKNLDIGMKQSIYAFLIISVCIIFSVLNNLTIFNSAVFAQQITLLFGISVFIGFISLLIMGQTLKILPFIVWLNKYQKLAGKGKTPLPKDLFSEKIAYWQFLSFIIGFLLLLFGILISTVIFIQIASLLLIAAALLYNFNVFKMLLHKTSIQPFPKNN
ncbi:MAG: hypothetical protein A3F72_21155 [Bacteroidetes bacterium RIFCSPLOWO2_12_FULL_35_15]|nr:MAG: hypothetical protein A3F72_21155 [Bacteroidetes bacterium RIFCSPLOWO2_12_FULL_35_15]